MGMYKYSIQQKEDKAIPLSSGSVVDYIRNGVCNRCDLKLINMPYGQEP